MVPVRRRAPDERGAILVLFMLILTVMLGFAAMIMDLANARQQKRQAQHSADAAALAGAQDLPDLVKVVTRVKEYAATNFDVELDEWVGCSDALALPVHPDLTNSNTCISVDSAHSTVRVLLPEHDVPSLFGQVLGVDNIDVTAAATAEAILNRDDRIIPAAVTAAAGTGNLCIENSGDDIDCDARTTGNFGSLDSPRLRIYPAASNVDQTELAINYAMGIDHTIGIYGTDPKVCDGDKSSPCTLSNVTSAKVANYLNAATGNQVPPVTEGYVTGFDAPTTDFGTIHFCGRLQRPDLTVENLVEPAPGDCATPATPTITVLGTTINGRHAYTWLTPAARSAFYPEVTSVPTPPIGHASYTAGDLRLECFLAGYVYNYATTTETLPNCTAAGLPPAQVPPRPIFEYEMVTDGRFGVIPVLESWPNGTSQPRRLVNFRAIYVYRLYASTTKVKAVDAWVFEPALIDTPSGVAQLQFGFQSEPIIHLVG